MPMYTIFSKSLRKAFISPIFFVIFLRFFRLKREFSHLLFFHECNCFSLFNILKEVLLKPIIKFLELFFGIYSELSNSYKSTEAHS